MMGYTQLALVGFQGRGFADGVPPDFYHSLLLKLLFFNSLKNEFLFSDNAGA
jgi:hypothetical protein